MHINDVFNDTPIRLSLNVLRNRMYIEHLKYVFVLYLFKQLYNSMNNISIQSNLKTICNRICINYGHFNTGSYDTMTVSFNQWYYVICYFVSRGKTILTL